MYTRNINIRNNMILHAKPASLLVREASKYDSDIKITKDGFSHNAKSIMGILSMGISDGDSVELRAEGRDEEIAIKSLIQLIDNSFND